MSRPTTSRCARGFQPDGVIPDEKPRSLNRRSVACSLEPSFMRLRRAALRKGSAFPKRSLPFPYFRRGYASPDGKEMERIQKRGREASPGKAEPFRKAARPSRSPQEITTRDEAPHEICAASTDLLRKVRGFSPLCPAGRARRLSRCDVGACRFGTTDLAW